MWGRGEHSCGKNIVNPSHTHDCHQGLVIPVATMHSLQKFTILCFMAPLLLHSKSLEPYLRKFLIIQSREAKKPINIEQSKRLLATKLSKHGSGDIHVDATPEDPKELSKKYLLASTFQCLTYKFEFSMSLLLFVNVKSNFL